MSHYFYITPEEYEEAARNGVSRKTLTQRIRQYGWNKQRAIQTPPRERKDLDEYWVNVSQLNGIKRDTFIKRIRKYGFSPQEAATRPLNDNSVVARVMIERNRKIPMRYIELAQRNGIKRATFYSRLKYGWPIEDAATVPTLTFNECGRRGAAKLIERHGNINALIFKTWDRKKETMRNVHSN